ncbi:MAG: hypothetical protein WC269_02825 [Candidatus Gracilibacteria bacterium]|jgi:hypothetical protein
MTKSKVLKQALLVFALMTGALALVSAFPGIASAALIGPGDNPSGVGDATGGEGDIRALVLRIVNFFLGFLGVVAVIMVIYGGVTYVTAAGKDDAIGNAKKIITYSLVGIVIILISFALVNTILGAGSAA